MYKIRKTTGTHGREAEGSENEWLRTETTETENTVTRGIVQRMSKAFIIAGTAFLGAGGPENMAAEMPTSMFPMLE